MALEKIPILGRLVRVLQGVADELRADRDAYLREVGYEFALLGFYLALLVAFVLLLGSSVPDLPGLGGIFTDPLVVGGALLAVAIVFCKPVWRDQSEPVRSFRPWWFARTAVLFVVLLLTGTTLATIFGRENGLELFAETITDLGGSFWGAVTGAEPVLLPFVVGTVLAVLAILFNVNSVISGVGGAIVGVIAGVFLLGFSIQGAVVGATLGLFGGAILVTGLLLLDDRVVDSRGAAGAVGLTVLALVVSGDPAYVVVAATLGGGIFSALTGEGVTEDLPREPTALKRMGRGRTAGVPGYTSSIGTTGERVSHRDGLGEYVLGFPRRRPTGLFYKGGYYLLLSPLVLFLPVVYTVGYLCQTCSAAYHNFEAPPFPTFEGWRTQIKEGLGALVGVAAYLVLLAPVAMGPLTDVEIPPAPQVVGVVSWLYGLVGLSVPLVESGAVTGVSMLVFLLVLPAILTSYSMDGYLTSLFHAPRVVSLVATREYAIAWAVQVAFVVGMVLPLVAAGALAVLAGFWGLVAGAIIALVVFPALLFYFLVASATLWGYAAAVSRPDHETASWGILAWLRSTLPADRLPGNVGRNIG